MGYKKYTVKQGDCISSIAFQHGFSPDTIWNDSKNNKLRQDRKDPNVLFPGDEVYICDKEDKEESCETEKRHRFKRKGVPERLRLQFMDEEGKGRANEACILDIDGKLSDSKTDKDGKIEIWIPPNAKKGKITFRDSGEEYELQLGELDPVTEITGVQARLGNLGFYEGEVDGKMSEELENAIRDFQEKKGLNPTGKLDESFRQKLENVYGG
ncbi:MAG: LysM peptidoglycan-binding domain-containing protein [Deltaproteobacteria bacterium]|nr:LysM peptidoglycan-binding domain-containing protein [Deltaproteobacteria bacterium]